MEIRTGNQFQKAAEYGEGKPSVRFGDLPVGLLTKEHGATRKKIVVSKGRRIPPRSMVAVAVQKTEAVQPGQEGATGMIEPERKL